MRFQRYSPLLPLSVALAMLGCASEPLDEGGGDGNEGGAPNEVETVLATTSVVFGPYSSLQPTALEFHPLRNDELWVTLREPATDEPCTATVSTGCEALIGWMAIISDADETPDADVKTDANGWHFLRRPSSLAFAEDGSFATCAEARTSNYENEAADFNGPVRWSSDVTLFGGPAQGETGSTHIDMLHETPYCMGLASEGGTVYWAFNGQVGALDRYDFHEPHPPGEDDHSDGEVWRYATGEVRRVEGVPSHLAYDVEHDELYVADTGNGRVIALDATSGTVGEPILAYDPITTRVAMNGASIREVVPPGTLVAPSGLVLHEGRVFVADHATGRIRAFERDGALFADIDTGSGAYDIAGIAVGPGGRLYFASLTSGEIRRIEEPVP
jgi:sugar lactone lactonase YvrE